MGRSPFGGGVGKGDHRRPGVGPPCRRSAGIVAPGAAAGEHLGQAQMQHPGQQAGRDRGGQVPSLRNLRIVSAVISSPNRVAISSIFLGIELRRAAGS